ncbi:hypothetical protein BV25DRAFT_504244 [Artomyces pyxidatus]|uniref:Uncharacterized protein n=1 Tax=Artomyces pyxidatus TaxID=48021 RepID=A0ACB8THW0_9AGAM|nr:hypothetical protein BV25DRAFT_504244 [Artomyces pyxidatus]
MASSLSQLSASVTRILSLTGFPKELKTRDIQTAFSEYENASGGFKIKWIDDTSLLIVFQDAAAAKRAYLSILANPPAVFSSPTSDTSAVIRPYDGPDAQAIIQNVNSRGGPTRGGHTGRSASVAIPATQRPQANGHGGGTPTSPIGREGSPTLPSLPSQPTLDSLITSSLADPAILAVSPASSGPRIGDPGKRMLGAALGVRHPGLAPRQVGAGNAEHAMKEIQRAMGGLAVAE